MTPADFETARLAVAQLARYMEGSNSIEDFALKLAGDRESPFFAIDVIAHGTALENAVSALIEASWGVFDDA